MIESNERENKWNWVKQNKRKEEQKSSKQKTKSRDQTVANERRFDESNVQRHISIFPTKKKCVYSVEKTADENWAKRWWKKLKWNEENPKELIDKWEMFVEWTIFSLFSFLIHRSYDSSAQFKEVVCIVCRWTCYVIASAREKIFSRKRSEWENWRIFSVPEEKVKCEQEAVHQQFSIRTERKTKTLKRSKNQKLFKWMTK